MPFQQTLSSIFLPTTSIYSSIDQPLPSSGGEEQPPGTRSPTPREDSSSLDPFSSVQSTPVTKPSTLPLASSSSSAVAAAAASCATRTTRVPGSSTRSTTHSTADPFDHGAQSTRTEDPGPRRDDEEFLPSSSHLKTSVRHHHPAMTSPSLMGLLGGGGGGRTSDSNDFEPRPKPTSGGATLLSRRDDDLDRHENEPQPTSVVDSLMPHRRDRELDPGKHSDDDPYTFERGILPEEEEEEEEEEEDEVPPDFTTRIPLLSSSRSPLSPPLHPSSTPSSLLSASPNRKHRSPRVVHPMSSLAVPTSNSSPKVHPTRLDGILGHATSPSLATTSSSVRDAGRRARNVLSMSARERALWRWANVEDLDKFLEEAYRYYSGKGVWTIGLERILNLLTVGWVIGFSTFLGGCLDYPKLWHADRLSDAVVPKCVSRLSGFSFLFFVLFVGFYAWRVAEFGLEVKKLWRMHEFYTELLEVPEDDIQTIPWHSIVNRLTLLRASHPSSLSSRQQARDEPLDAHSVANRIMRSQNYLIALLNAPNVLDFSLPLPNIRFVKKWIGRDGRIGQGWLTKALEWNLNWTVLGFVFDERGTVREMILSERKRKDLIKALKNRFILVGILNALFAPFIVIYLLVYSFFRYFEEYHKNPSSLSSRQFTPLAIYKFRSFNELDHEFSLRLSSIRPLANLYLSSYPRAKTALVSRFVAFLAGSFAAVLIVFSILDPDAFLHFEVTPGRTVLFWIGILGGVVAVARGMTPAQEGEAVRARLEPGELMKEIVELSRYCPEEWEGKLHAYSVHQSFAPLFPPKPLLFLQELSSVLLTPLILLFTLPNCAGNVVDFFRDFTIEVEGLGRVCSFAVFDLKNDGARKTQSAGYPHNQSRNPSRSRQISAQSTATTRFRNMENKMEKSLLNFAVSNPDWQPRDEAQSLFLSQMLSDHHPGPVPALPLSTAHLPHLQHATHSLSNHNFVRSPPASRAASHARTHTPHPSYPTKFSSLHPHEEIRNRNPRGGDRSKLYDRAFQQRSHLLSSSSQSQLQPGGGGFNHRYLNGSTPQGYSRSNPPNRKNGYRGGGGTGGEDSRMIIEEESRLDGEFFVAPTRELPFGFVVEPGRRGVREGEEREEDYERRDHDDEDDEGGDEDREEEQNRYSRGERRRLGWQNDDQLGKAGGGGRRGKDSILGGNSYHHDDDDDGSENRKIPNSNLSALVGELYRR